MKSLFVLAVFFAHLLSVSGTVATEANESLSVFTNLEQRIAGCDLILVGKIRNMTASRRDGLIWRSEVVIRASRSVGGTSQRGDYAVQKVFLSSGTHWDMHAMLAQEFGIAMRNGVASDIGSRLDAFATGTKKQGSDSVFLIRSHNGRKLIADVFAAQSECKGIEALARIIHQGRWKEQGPVVFAEGVAEEVQLAACRWVAENGGQFGISIGSLEKAIRHLPVARSARLLDEAIRHLTGALKSSPFTTEALNPKLGRLGELLEAAQPASESAIQSLAALAGSPGRDQVPGAAAHRARFISGLKDQLLRTTDPKRRAALEQVLKSLEPKPSISQ